MDLNTRVLDEKIKELESVKSYINFLEDRIKETKEVEENKIFIKYNDKRVVKKYNCIIRNELY